MSLFTREEAFKALGFGLAGLTALLLVVWPMMNGGESVPRLHLALVPAVPILGLGGGLCVVRAVMCIRAQRSVSLDSAQRRRAGAKAQAAREKLTGFEERGTFVATFGLGFGAVAILLMLPGHLSDGVEEFVASGAVWTVLGGAMLMLALVGLATGGAWTFLAVRYRWWEVTLGKAELD